MNKIENYVTNQVLTASPAELIMMLFEEGIRTLKKAEAAFADETPARFQEINKHLVHAQDVLMELSSSLDLEKGGDLAANLQRLYAFMLRHLTNANAAKKRQPVIEVREMLTTLQEAWKKVMEESLQAKSSDIRQDFSRPRILAAG